MNGHQLLRYNRRILLGKIGIEGQEKLLGTYALVVGCGGSGVAALPYLAVSSIGRLIIANPNAIDDTSLQRQITFAEADIGRSKALVMEGHLKDINSQINITTLPEKLTETHLTELMRVTNIVFDCCDNFPTHQAVSRATVATRAPLASGAVVRFDGQIVVYRPDLPDSPCYTYLFDGDTADDGACALFGVLSPLVGIVGATQAAETLRVLAGIGTPTHSELMTCGVLAGEWHTFRLGRRPECRVCGGRH